MAIAWALSLCANRGLKSIGFSPREPGDTLGARNGSPAVSPVGGRAPVLKIAMPVPRTGTRPSKTSAPRPFYPSESQGLRDGAEEYPDRAIPIFRLSDPCRWDSELPPVGYDANGRRGMSNRRTGGGFVLEGTDKRKRPVSRATASGVRAAESERKEASRVLAQTQGRPALHLNVSRNRTTRDPTGRWCLAYVAPVLADSDRRASTRREDTEQPVGSGSPW